MQLRAKTAVYTQELLVHDSSERQGAEGLHACIVDLLRVLMLALQFESKVIRQMTTLVVPTEQP